MNAGYCIKTVRVNAVLMERFEAECRKREGAEGYCDPNIHDFINYALEEHLDDYLKEFPIVQFNF